jgi:hypothetical protein
MINGVAVSYSNIFAQVENNPIIYLKPFGEENSTIWLMGHIGRCTWSALDGYFQLCGSEFRNKAAMNNLISTKDRPIPFWFMSVPFWAEFITKNLLIWYSTKLGGNEKSFFPLIEE